MLLCAVLVRVVLFLTRFIVGFMGEDFTIRNLT